MNATLDLLWRNDRWGYGKHFKLLEKVDQRIEVDCPAEWTPEEARVYLLADYLKEMYELLLDDTQLKVVGVSEEYYRPEAHRFRELLVLECIQYAIQQVNWGELARDVIRAKEQKEQA